MGARMRWVLGTGWLSLACTGCFGAQGSLSGLGGEDATSSTSSGDVPTSTGSEGSTSGPAGPSAARLYAEVRCEAAQGCGCDLESLGSLDECVASMEARFLVWQEGFGDAGSFDATCFESVLEFYTSTPCRTHQQIALEDLAPDCNVYGGTRMLGESCASGGGTASRGDLCGAGLKCLPTLQGYQCHPPEEYDALTPGLGEVCASGGQAKAVCDAGLFCELQPSGTCQPRVALGEVCTDPNSCEAGTYCDLSDLPEETTGPGGMPVCATKVEPGTACVSSSECAPTGCDAGACTRPVCHQDVCTVDVPQVCFLSDL